MGQDKDVTLTVLEDIAEEVKECLLEEGQFEWRDVTDAYLVGKRELYAKGRNVKEAFIADTRLGKSSIAIKSADDDNTHILRYKEENKGLPKEGEINMLPYICQSPDEFSRIAKSTGIAQTAVVIDEGVSAVEGTGLDQGIEIAKRKYIMDVCAEKGIHIKICSPDPSASQGCQLIHHVIGLSKTHKITKTKLYWFDHTEQRKIPIGIVTWNVGELLEKPYYKMYQKRKTFAYKLVLENAVRSIRDVEFALITLIAFEHSKKLLTYGIKDVDILSIRVDSAMKELSELHSMLTKEELVGRLRAFATLITKQHECDRELTRTNRRTPLSDKEKEYYNIVMKECGESLQKLQQEYYTLTELYLQYLAIGNSSIFKSMVELVEKYNFPIKIPKVQK
jgi:hypothetical protein